MQIYRGMDVGSDKLPVSERRGTNSNLLHIYEETCTHTQVAGACVKPNTCEGAEQRAPMHAGIPHHLIDVLDPLDGDAEYSAGQFHDAAHAAVQDVHARGRTALVIGGTGFYLRTFMNGKPGGGKATPAVEAQVRALLRTALVDAAEAAGREEVAGARLHALVDRALHSAAPGDAAAESACIANAVLAAVREEHGDTAAENCGVWLWSAACDVLRGVGDPAGANRFGLLCFAWTSGRNVTQPVCWPGLSCPLLSSLSWPRQRTCRALHRTPVRLLRTCCLPPSSLDRV